MPLLLIDSLQTLKNVARNVLRPKYFREMSHKILVRMQSRGQEFERAASSEWCRKTQFDVKDQQLWRDAATFGNEHDIYSRKRLSTINAQLSGGGFSSLLFFLTRYFKPQYVLETGVAAGHSSRAILSALKINGEGHLWSSDFPLFRLDEPEQHIGVLVEEELRSIWKLKTEGDRVNLPLLLADMPRVDFLHFDSDKSVSGREYVSNMTKSKIHDRSVLMFDDIQDNLHFKNTFATPSNNWLVFAFEGKWIGIVFGPGLNVTKG
jgi:predicted O-methyltransferase YrrM